MRKVYILILFAFCSIISFAQNVEDIRAEQDGNKINIYYQIKNTNSKQVFNVTISCLVNNDKKIVLKAITGDVGVNIQGGKSEYIAVWDVLKEVDELNNAEFFVDIELSSKIETADIISPSKKHNWWVSTNSSIQQPFGIRGGYVNKWGGYFSCKFGEMTKNENYINYYCQEYIPAYTDVNDVFHSEYNFEGYKTEYGGGWVTTTYTFTVGGVRQVFDKGNIRMHVFAGGGLSNWDTWSSYGSYEGDFIPDLTEYPYTLNYEVYDEASNEYIPGYYYLDSSYEIEDINGNMVFVSKADYSKRIRIDEPYVNLEIELGAILEIKRFTIMLGATTCWFQGYDIVGGIGYKF